MVVSGGLSLAETTITNLFCSSCKLNDSPMKMDKFHLLLTIYSHVLTVCGCAEVAADVLAVALNPLICH